MIKPTDSAMSVEAEYNNMTKYGFTAFVIVTTLFVSHSMLYASESVVQALFWATGPAILIAVNIDAYLFKIIVKEGKVVRDGIIRKEIKFSRLREFKDEEKRLILRSGSGLLEYIYVSKQLRGYKDVEDAILSQVEKS